MAQFPLRRTLSSLLTKTLTRPIPSSPGPSRLSVSLLLSQNPAQKTHTRPKSTGSGYSPLNDPSPNWNNRPPKETILLDGCDYEHWLIVMEFPTDPKPTDEQMVNSYVTTLAQIVGSEEEAKKKIYSLSTTTYTGFGALISEELSYKVKALPGVLWVLPDSYLDVPNKDYGGDLFVDGKVIRRPEYDYSERQHNTRHRPRPRHDMRRETRPNFGRGPMPTQSPSLAHDRTQSTGQQMTGQNVPQIQGGYPSVN